MSPASHPSGSHTLQSPLSFPKSIRQLTSLPILKLEEPWWNFAWRRNFCTSVLKRAISWLSANCWTYAKVHFYLFGLAFPNFANNKNLHFTCSPSQFPGIQPIAPAAESGADVSVLWFKWWHAGVEVRKFWVWSHCALHLHFCTPPRLHSSIRTASDFQGFYLKIRLQVTAL